MNKVQLSAGGCNIELQAFPTECNPGYHNPVQKILMQMFEKANMHREEQIVARLAQLGYTFSTLHERRAFFKERMALCPGHHPDWRELYLMPEQILIASWWETVEFETFTGDNYAAMGKIVIGDHPKSRL